MNNVNAIQQNMAYIQSQMLTIPNPPQTVQQQQALQSLQGQYVQLQQQLMALQQPMQQPMHQPVVQQTYYQQPYQVVGQTMGSPYNTYQPATQASTTSRYSSNAKPIQTPQPVIATPQQPTVVQQPTAVVDSSQPMVGHEYPLLVTSDRKEVKIKHGGFYTREVEMAGNPIELEIKVCEDGAIKVPYASPYDIYSKFKTGVKSCNAFCTYGNITRYETMDVDTFTKINAALESLNLNTAYDFMNVVKESSPTLHNLLNMYYTMYFNTVSCIHGGRDVKIDNIVNDLGDVIGYVNELKLIKTKEAFTKLLTNLVEDITSNLKLVFKEGLMQIELTTPTLIISDSNTYEEVLCGMKDSDITTVREESFTELHQALKVAIEDSKFHKHKDTPILVTIIGDGYVSRYGVVTAHGSNNVHMFKINFNL